MSQATENLHAAIERAIDIRPKVGGFPHLAETLRRAGVTRNLWFLPACQAVYLTTLGPVVNQHPPLVSGMVDVPRFDRNAIILALRTNQAGNSTFPEFLASAWSAGIVRYEVDFAERTVSYFGIDGEVYVEAYPAAHVD
jgi:uncharacterized protein YbcV (DUF1398 family)